MDGLEPQQRQADVRRGSTASRRPRARRRVTIVPGGGRGAVDPHRQQPLLDQAAIFRAGGQLLADIAALLPIDAVQFVEARIRAGSICRRTRSRLPSGMPSAEAQPVVGGEIRPRRGRAPASAGASVSRGRMHAGAERGEPRVDERDARAERPRRAGFAGRSERGERAVAEHRRHGEIGLLVERRPWRAAGTSTAAASDRRAAPASASSQIASPRLDHDEIVQVFALRGQQRGIDAPRRRRPCRRRSRPAPAERRARSSPPTARMPRSSSTANCLASAIGPMADHRGRPAAACLASARAAGYKAPDRRNAHPVCDRDAHRRRRVVDRSPVLSDRALSRRAADDCRRAGRGAAVRGGARARTARSSSKSGAGRCIGWRFTRAVAARRWDLVVDLRGSALAWLLRAGERRVDGQGRRARASRAPARRACSISIRRRARRCGLSAGSTSARPRR